MFIPVLLLLRFPPSRECAFTNQSVRLTKGLEMRAVALRGGISVYLPAIPKGQTWGIPLVTSLGPLTGGLESTLQTLMN